MATISAWPGASDGAVPIGVITGLIDEARLARPIGDALASGGTAFGAEEAAERLITRGATALLSFGLAGGLHPSLRPGEIVVPRAVIDTGESFVTDAVLAKAAGGWSGGVIIASETVVVTREAKRHLFETTRAAAVDMESGAVARVAARHGMPFAVARAICDPATRTLPAAALVALSAQGEIKIKKVLRAILGRPQQIPDLLGLARDMLRARRSLTRLARLIAKNVTDWAP